MVNRDAYPDSLKCGTPWAIESNVGPALFASGTKMAQATTAALSDKCLTYYDAALACSQAGQPYSVSYTRGSQYARSVYVPAGYGMRCARWLVEQDAILRAAENGVAEARELLEVAYGSRRIETPLFTLVPALAKPAPRGAFDLTLAKAVLQAQIREYGRNAAPFDEWAAELGVDSLAEQQLSPAQAYLALREGDTCYELLNAPRLYIDVFAVPNSGKHFAIWKTIAFTRIKLEHAVDGVFSAKQVAEEKNSNLDGTRLADGSGKCYAVKSIAAMRALLDAYDTGLARSDESTEEPSIESVTMPEADVPKNLILYGPPGTGKTYATLSRAVAIADGSLPDHRSEVILRYRELEGQGRVAFVTFHQSYSYEDFVEGIRPVLDDAADDGQIRYECRHGIFRQLCERARGGDAQLKETFAYEPGATRVWKMSLGNTNDPEQAFVFDECIAENRLMLGYGEGLDFTGCDSRDAVLRKLREHDPRISSSNYNVTALEQFKNRMQDGDLVVVSHGNKAFRAIGVVDGGYEFLGSDREYAQTRGVRWIAVFDQAQPYELILNNVFSQATIYRLYDDRLNHDGLKRILDNRDNAAAENFVLVIDEINRGNIAKILGELITLLEPDKRLGGHSEIRVRLPYSNDEFGVPANVHVIGTMNTADRSIAFLDAALRRRFEFEELMPDAAAVRANVGEAGRIGEIDVARLMDVLNHRIEALLDREHQLGHAYFLGVKTLTDLRQMFVGRVIPLLQEYFFGDWRLIGQVLGSDTGSGHTAANEDYRIIRPQVIGSNAGAAGFGLESADRWQINPAFRNAAEAELSPFFIEAVRAGESE